MQIRVFNWKRVVENFEEELKEIIWLVKWKKINKKTLTLIRLFPAWLILPGINQAGKSLIRVKVFLLIFFRSTSQIISFNSSSKFSEQENP
jgi:hypothetical protein